MSRFRALRAKELIAALAMHGFFVSRVRVVITSCATPTGEPQSFQFIQGKTWAGA